MMSGCVPDQGGNFGGHQIAKIAMCSAVEDPGNLASCMLLPDEPTLLQRTLEAWTNVMTIEDFPSKVHEQHQYWRFRYGETSSVDTQV